jgi:hypothetical protein
MMMLPKERNEEIPNTNVTLTYVKYDVCFKRSVILMFNAFYLINQIEYIYKI